jgi:hypothetical protein
VIRPTPAAAAMLAILISGSRKLPPPPRILQNRSACSRSLARTMLPSASTTSAEMRLSHARPYIDDVQP